MGVHLKTRFTPGEVIEILERYISKEIGIKESLALLKISRRQFFDVLKKYQQEGENFVLSEKRKVVARRLSEEINQRILEELSEEKRIIDDKATPVCFYNYSYVKNLLEKKHQVKVSLPSIIDRAKKMVIIENGGRDNSMIERFSQTM